MTVRLCIATVGGVSDERLSPTARASLERLADEAGAGALFEHHVVQAARYGDDDLGEHLLLEDLRVVFLRFVEVGDQDGIRRFLDGIERLASSGDARLRNVVEISFIEDLLLGNPREQRALASVSDGLGPVTASMLSEQQEATKRARERRRPKSEGRRPPGHG